MKISTKGRYALRLMADLALHDDGGYTSIKSVAARQDISEKYLEQIITQLSRAGFVKSVRGAQGGYRLAYNSEHYTVGMVLRVMEGNLSPVACLDGDENTCERAGECVTLWVWEELTEAINHVVDHITIADIVKKQKDKIGFDYMI